MRAPRGVITYPQRRHSACRSCPSALLQSFVRPKIWKYVEGKKKEKKKKKVYWPLRPPSHAFCSHQFSKVVHQQNHVSIAHYIQFQFSWSVTKQNNTYHPLQILFIPKIVPLLATIGLIKVYILKTINLSVSEKQTNNICFDGCSQK